ncbi:MAG: type VI secretion system tip protein VgrG [Phycisphaeraceae bacterium]|nr:MAG: type VI secretion system tip protein VgrG [Phycisphaeraceae bacterium]
MTTNTSGTDQANIASFRLAIDGLSKANVDVVSFELTESLLEPTTAKVRFAVRDTTPEPSDLIGRQATLTVTNGSTPRNVLNIVTEASRAETVRGRVYFSATLRHPMALLAMNQTCRVFAHACLPDVIRRVMTEAGLIEGRHFDIELQERHLPRECIIQYHESDLDFITRMLEEEGALYAIDASSEDQPVVFFDAQSGLPRLDIGTLPYNAPDGFVTENESISNVEIAYRVGSASAKLQDYHFEEPHAERLSACEETEGIESAFGEIFQFIDQHRPDPALKDLVARKLDERTADRILAKGRSTCPRLSPGLVFGLDDVSGRLGTSGEFQVIEIAHTGVESQSTGAEGAEAGGRYNNEFIAIPVSRRYRRTPRIPKPRIHGMQAAIVVGPTDGQPHVDEHGRIQVRFRWQTDYKLETAPWVRVAQAWAGSGWGVLALPRVGQEVLLTFVDGDPDRPFVVGSLFNGEATPPQSLPGDACNMTIRSWSLNDSGGHNEITLDDTGGNERVFVKAQHNMIEEVGNDRTRSVANNESVSVSANQSITVGANRTDSVSANEDRNVGGNRSHTITGNENLTVSGSETETITLARTSSIGGNESLTVGGMMTTNVALALIENVGGAKTETVGGAIAMTAGGVINIAAGGAVTEQAGGYRLMAVAGDMKIRVGGDTEQNTSGKHVLKASEVTIDVGRKLILQCGGSQIILDPATITINAPMVKINS